MAKKKPTNESLIGSIYVNEGSGLIHSYDLYQNDDDQTIIRYGAGTSLWTQEIRGDVAGVLNDDGDAVTISIGDEHIRLDYAEMEVLTALIMSCNDTEMELREHKTTASLKPTR